MTTHAVTAPFERSSREPQTALFEQLMALHGAGLARLVKSYTKTAADEDDLAQEVASAIWRALPSFRYQASTRTFAYRIAHNQCITHLRRRRPEGVTDTDVADTRPDPDHQVLAQERRTQLRRAVAQLPVAIRQVVVMALEELPRKEIADILGLSENAVGLRLSRGKKLLASQLSREGLKR